MRDTCLNLAIWFFSFRYWNISFVMPVQLSGNEVTNTYKVTSLTIFCLGVALNISIPIMYAVFSFKLNVTLDQPDEM